MNTKDYQILIVEDQQEMLCLLAADFQGEGYQVISASTGRQALDAITPNKPDMVLLDLMLPDMDGFEVCKAMKAARKDRFLPVIAVSAVVEIEKKIEGFESGADDYVTKPFNRQELKARVRTMMRLKESQDNLSRALKNEKDLLAEMELKNDMLLRMNILKDTFLAIASHDLMDLLKIIRVAIETFNAPDIKLSQEQTKLLNATNKNVLYMIAILKDLMKRAVQSGTIPVNLKQESPSLILRECFDNYAALSREKRVSMQGNIPDNLPTVLVDVIRIKQAFNILLGNAVKFTPSGGSAYLNAKEEGQTIVIDVIDTGPGIAAKDMPKLFRPFKKLDEAAVYDEKDENMGLYIVKEIVDLHNGDLKVKSEPGKGSCFSIILPSYKATTS